MPSRRNPAVFGVADPAIVIRCYFLSQVYVALLLRSTHTGAKNYRSSCLPVGPSFIKSSIHKAHCVLAHKFMPVSYTSIVLWAWFSFGHYIYTYI